MAEASLVTEKVTAGEWLIRAADAKRVPLRAALWVYDGADDRWRLVLEADPKAKLGPLDFSRLLHEAAAAIKDPAHREAARELLLFDAAVFTRPHPVSKALRPSLGRAASVSRTRMHHTVLYRLEASQRL